ncbi:zinc ABC transporter substrate-binding protein [Roseicyclus sp. F158]|uniref:High-affinity zinc uptake system protein ZnuA n=1 Tax=Tropicimonas omnivorans TaxID=3075590 RepID=A0ABU3DH19_9RHOB|nr:zinc ABC transporter substrate-binding protein [Roseicyclus sp. F158]MDT0683015.1 zinc ABC transporter substrate-binding protein [Roseicyclus sp. F158]
MSIRLTTFSGLAGLLASGAALADVPQVVTDIPPVHSLVARVMDGIEDEPSLLVKPGVSPHGYAMRPSEARALQDADAVFWIGPDLTPSLEGSIANLADGAEIVGLLDLPDTQTLAFRHGATFEAHDHGDHDHEHGEHQHDHDEEHAGHDHDHADHDHGEEHAEHDHEHDDAHEHAGHDHAHDGTDPHAWLDPENAKVWLDQIASTLSDLDPDNAAAYASNAEAGKTEIDDAVARASETLAPVSDLQFIVFHDAYQYFETRLELSAAGAISLSDASSPSPARIEEVRDTVLDLGVSCVLSEPQFNQGLVRTVADGTGVSSGIIDPLGTDIPLGPDFYPALIRTVAEEVASCGK